MAAVRSRHTSRSVYFDGHRLCNHLRHRSPRHRTALGELGFRPRGRTFVHRDTGYALDFVADTPYIDREPVYDFAEISTSVGPVRVLRLDDAIADRISAFLHWSDSESLDVAERSIAAARDRLTWGRVDAALLRLDTSTKESAQRMALARDRLRRALAGR